MPRVHRFVGLATVLGALALLPQVARAGQEAAENKPFGRLSVDQVQQLVDSNGASIFDNNGKSRYNQGHVPGAIWVKPSAVTAQILPTDKDRKLVFYCGNGR